MKARRGILILCALFALACSAEVQRLAERISGGSVPRGRAAFDRYGCGTCHELHGEGNARGHVGPTLHDFALQQALPGGSPNTPAALTRWLRSPRTIVPGTAMPDLGVTETDARDLVAFLYTLR